MHPQSDQSCVNLPSKTVRQRPWSRTAFPRSFRGIISAASLLWAGITGLASPALARQQAEQPTTPPALERAVSFDDARAIVAAAREHRNQVRKKPDCSNLVHEVYRRAGFEYPYATSRELYAGIEHFVRVEQPQRGDLIVWRGHVGIVVEPAMRAFYSAIKSGLRLDFYDSPYWRKRGRARFFRYVNRSREPERTMLAKSAESKESRADAAKAVLMPAGKAPGSEGRTSPPPDASGQAWPNRILVRTSGNRPTKKEIARAVVQLTEEAARVLREQDRWDWDLPLVIVDRIEVEKVEMEKDRGRAWIQSDVKLSVVAGSLEAGAAKESRLWELQRTSQGWELTAPENRAYISRKVALRTLQAELASRKKNTRTAEDSEEAEGRQKIATQMLSALAERQ